MRQYPHMRRKHFCGGECGQSLVEFVIITPIFFIILSGIISIFYLQSRNYIDFEANISMSMNQFLFDEEERKIGQWDEFAKNRNDELKDILDKSLNSSLAFTLATNKKDQVFIDKERIIYTNENCISKNTYFFSGKEKGEFQLSTCADKNGYERAHFSFAKVLDKFSLSIFHSKSSSFYYPFYELQWPQRSSLIVNANHEFMLSMRGVLFAKNVASLTFPQDFSKFNKKCFMDAFYPECYLHQYSGKFERAAKHGANTQLFACHAEMALECTRAGVYVAACIAKGVAEIELSTLLGKAASSCPLVNKEIEASIYFVKAKSLYDSAANMAQEARMR